VFFDQFDKCLVRYRWLAWVIVTVTSNEYLSVIQFGICPSHVMAMEERTVFYCATSHVRMKCYAQLFFNELAPP
jgi:hypothetical protein